MNHYFSGTEPTPAYRSGVRQPPRQRRSSRSAPASRRSCSRTCSRRSISRAIREQIVHEIQQVFDGKVIWGEDLMRLGIAGSRVDTIEPRQEHEHP